MGPRAVRKEKEFLEQAKKENLEQNREEFCFEKTYKNKVPVFEQIESSDKFQDAITFWGQQRSNHSNHENISQSFAKCTSFTNDIRDGRLTHSR